MAVRPSPLPSPQAKRPVAGAFDPGERKTHKVLLPSYRVAAFVKPNVGELLRMQEEAIAAQGDSLHATGMTIALRATALRRLLKGMSAAPAPVILKQDTNAQAAADAAEAELLASEEQKPEKQRMSGDKLDDRIAEARAVAEMACEDVDAMVASANLLRVEDAQWEVNGYLIDCQRSEIGSIEAADWLALNQAAMDLVHELSALSQGSADPKVRARIQRPRT